MFKRLSVAKESEAGRILVFRDNRTRQVEIGRIFADKVLGGNFGGYHIRIINGIPTIVSNPDRSLANNLG